MVEKVRVAIATGEASKECWYLLTSLPPHRCSPGEMLRLFRSHWSIEKNLHHVKDRSWDEDRHTLRRPGLGEVFATLVNVSLNTLRLACVWLAFGLRLACVWLAFGLRLACVWLAFGLRLACVWLAFGLRLACVWLGLRLACVWLAFGLRLACVWLACVWLAFGLRLACVWLAFGLRLACVWLAFGRMVSFRNVHAAASQDLCLPPGTDYRPALRTCNLTLQLS